jgi:hypothetical protein
MSAEFDALSQEHAQSVIGPALADLLARIVRATAVMYPPTEYADGDQWTPEALDDLLQDWLTDRLVGRGHLAAMMAMSTSTSVLRAALTTSLSQFLANRRRRTSAANLFKRSQILLEGSHDFKAVITASKPADVFWTLKGAGAVVPSSKTLAELVATAHELTDADLEVVHYGPISLKSSPIMREPQLLRFLIHVLSTSDGALSLRTIAEVINHRFNLVEPRVEALDQTLSAEAPDPVRHAETADAARRAIARLGRERLNLMREVNRSESIEEAAKKLGINPRTASKRLKEAITIVSDYAESIEEARDIYRLIAESLF